MWPWVYSICSSKKSLPPKDIMKKIPLWVWHSWQEHQTNTSPSYRLSRTRHRLYRQRNSPRNSMISYRSASTKIPMREQATPSCWTTGSLSPTPRWKTRPWGASSRRSWTCLLNSSTSLGSGWTFSNQVSLLLLIMNDLKPSGKSNYNYSSLSTNLIFYF